MTALPQRYSHQRRRTGAAAARRMERRRREQGRNSDGSPSGDHSHRSKKLAMLSRYESATGEDAEPCGKLKLQRSARKSKQTPKPALYKLPPIDFIAFYSSCC